jgi:hypothetical protein
MVRSSGVETCSGLLLVINCWGFVHDQVSCSVDTLPRPGVETSSFDHGLCWQNYVVVGVYRVGGG